MNEKEIDLSLYLDGRLSGDAKAAFEQRLAAEPELRHELDALRRLQELSQALPPAHANFTADDVRLRAQATSGRRWARAAVAVAAVLVLALSHGVVFHLGTKRGVGVERSRVQAAEDLLARAADLDPEASPERLRVQLADLHEEIRPQLIALDNDPAPKAVHLAEALRHIDFALEQQRDPGISGITVSFIARSSLQGGSQVRFVPRTGSYTRLVPIGGNRYRLVFIRTEDGIPMMAVDEGTRAELEKRHAYYFVNEAKEGD
ncbi:MAG: anti-sigma factor family protein [Planctomycetota bacterium]